MRVTRRAGRGRGGCCGSAAWPGARRRRLRLRAAGPKCWRIRRSPSVADAEELDEAYQGRVRGDGRREAAGAVGEAWGDGDARCLAHPQALDGGIQSCGASGRPDSYQGYLSQECSGLEWRQDVVGTFLKNPTFYDVAFTKGEAHWLPRCKSFFVSCTAKVVLCLIQ